MPTSRPAPPNTADRKYLRCTSNHNVNTWLGDDPTKRYLIRTLRGAGNQPGIALTERRMYVKVRSPEAAAHAPRLLEDYRSPFSGLRGADNPLIFAGFVISNSEVGHGSFSITPQITIQVCDNGMTFTNAMREVHLGGRLADGVRDTDGRCGATAARRARSRPTRAHRCQRRPAARSGCPRSDGTKE